MFDIEKSGQKQLCKTRHISIASFGRVSRNLLGGGIG